MGGGVTGSWTALLLSPLARRGLLHLSWVDSGHPVRGSWGHTRALHTAMEDRVRIQVLVEAPSSLAPSTLHPADEHVQRD